MLYLQLLNVILSPLAAILAAALAVFLGYRAVLRHDNRRRDEEKENVARTLLQELADRAARCAYDFESVWADYGKDPPDVLPMEVPRLQKFLALDPVVYPTIGAKLALLPPGAAATMIHFYYRLHAWNRDVQFYIDEFRRERQQSPLLPRQARALSQRLGQTLFPAYFAIKELSQAVPDREAICKSALATYREPTEDLPSYIQRLKGVARGLPIEPDL